MPKQATHRSDHTDTCTSVASLKHATKTQDPLPKTLACVNFTGLVSGKSRQCERILRSLPRRFGIESALLEYAYLTDHYPTFLAEEGADVLAFLSIRKHFPESWEVHCLAVHAERRGEGIGRALHAHVEQWLALQGARTLQVKTIADTHPSPEYAETRHFYSRIGYLPLEVFPQFWGPELPMLQWVKQVLHAT